MCVYTLTYICLHACHTWVGGIGDANYAVLTTIVFRLGFALSALPFGYYSDNFSDKECILTSCVIASVGNTIYIAASSLSWESMMLFGRFVTGSSVGA